MRRRVTGYILAAMLAAAVAGGVFGPFHCNEIYGCMGGLTTGWAWAVVVGSGAVVGLLAAAAVDIAVNLPYALANRREAERLKNIE